MSSRGISRKTFIQRALLGAGALAGASWLGWRWLRPKSVPPIAGEIVGANANIGHLLRKAVQLPFAEEVEETGVLIAGGGIAGLSAGWKLKKDGHDDYLILELHDQPGGNSVWDKERKAPWGAHYLPVPDPANRELLELCDELGFLEWFPGSEIPHVKDIFLCHDPQERLLLHGRWQDGLVPQFGVSEENRRQIERFFAEMELWKNRKGADGRYAFEIPLEKSSRDPELLALDKISFDDWLRDRGFDSEPLLWYVNYSCRDDYGVPHTEVSAWAGLHYFAARRAFLPNVNSAEVMTWPEGNGRLADGLAQLHGQKLRCNALLTELRNTESGVEAVFFDIAANVRRRVRAKSAIYAGPHFTVPYVCPEAPRRTPSGFQYAPWVVANVTLRERPTGPGRPLSWDNVSFESDSLGYVVSDHQSLGSKPNDQLTITWYQPLDDRPPKEAREMALVTTWEQWRDRVLSDLEGMHPGISGDVERLDVWVWGHGMISPRVGFLWGGDREKAAAPLGRISFAHSDLSGISIFEEAFYQGLRAAGEAISV